MDRPLVKPCLTAGHAQPRPEAHEASRSSHTRGARAVGMACTRGMRGRAQGAVEVAKASGTGRALRQGAEHQQGEQRGNNKRAAASSPMEQEQR